MIKRRLLGQSQLEAGDVLLSLTNFPRLGSDPCCTDPEQVPSPDSGPSQSLFLRPSTHMPGSQLLRQTSEHEEAQKSPSTCPFTKTRKRPSLSWRPCPKALGIGTCLGPHSLTSLKMPSLTMSTWTACALGWVAAVFRSPFKLVRWKRQDDCMTSSPSLLPSW